MARLTKLESLQLSGNALNGSIPAALGNLAQLYRLSLFQNELSGPIPPELGQLTNLRFLYLSDNALTGRVPTELGMTSLEELNLLGISGLTGPLPRSFMQLSGLQSLTIEGTGVCVPADAAVQAWLATLSFFNSSGLGCDGSLSVAFGASSYVVTEGGSVPVTVRFIDRSEGPPRSATATISLMATPGGGATSADYAGVPAHVTITAQATVASFVVRALDDNVLDDGETVVLGFRGPLPAGIAAGAPATARVTINDPNGAALDRAALEALYHATGGPNWTNSTILARRRAVVGLVRGDDR